MSSDAKPAWNGLLTAVVTVIGVALGLLSLVTGFPWWVTAAVVAGSVAGVAAWSAPVVVGGLRACSSPR